MFITDEFFKRYENLPFPNNNGFGEFVYLRTYSRFLPEKNRRETWAETVKRVVEYSLSLYQGPASLEELKKEAEELFDNIFYLRLFPAGRTLWVGGTKASELYPLSNFNCSFIVIDNYENLVQLLYALMVGSGVGFRVLQSDIKKLPKINSEVQLAHKPYDRKKPKERKELTEVYVEEDNVLIVVGDSKSGWTDALRSYFEFMVKETTQSIIFSYDNVRPEGEILKTFGGRASGHLALKNMFKKIHKVIKDRSNNRKMVSLKPIDLLDICNIIGEGIVVGGVRRTAQICLFSPEDEDILNAKLDLYKEGSPNYGKFWRALSNNSIFFSKKPDKEYLKMVLERTKNNGEPGFVNWEAMTQSRPNAQGGNPCMEILLDSKGVCNLTEVNLTAFVDFESKTIKWGSLERAMKLATRIGLRQTNVNIELPDWNKIQQRDRLLGVSITGYCDMMDVLGFSDYEQTEFLKRLRQLVEKESLEYAYEMRVPIPLLRTTVKPSGTISSLPTISNGVHRSFAPYYIRRVRISKTDPLSKVALDCGFPVYPEAGQTSYTAEAFSKLNDYDKMKALEQASTWVIEFPLKSPTKIKANEESVEEQLKRYFMFQENYTEHNTSITVLVRDGEWDKVLDIIWKRWEEYIGISFLPVGNDVYPLMPYEEITEEEYQRRLKEINSWDFYSKLIKYEKTDESTELLDLECNNGVCPIR